MKRVAIMQPYFFPYIGYLQLIAAVDLFIVYDNIKYTKKGWINRNRMLRDGKDVMFSLPMKSGSDTLDIRERELAADFKRDKLLNQIGEAYRQAPHFAETFPLVERIVRHEDANLFRYLHQSIVNTCRHLGINTEIRISSSIDADHELKSQDKVLGLCAAVGATTYVNAIGGRELYAREIFQERGMVLKFVQSKPITYKQWTGEFVPWLSIIDVMMFNPLETVQSWITDGYELV